MRLSTLISALPGRLSLPEGVDPEITRVTADSRQVEPGALFVAVEAIASTAGASSPMPWRAARSS
jgi:hypothetical protein